MLIKLRANIPEIILGALLAVAIFAMGMMFGSSQQTPSHQQHQTENRETKTQPPQQHGSQLWGESDPAVTGATFLLFIVGIAQAIMFYVQLRYMKIGIADASAAARAAAESVAIAKETIKLNRESADLDRRAWLSISKVTFVEGLAVGETDDFTETMIEIKTHNVGRSPAFVTFWADLIPFTSEPIADTQTRVVNEAISRTFGFPPAVIFPDKTIWPQRAVRFPTGRIDQAIRKTPEGAFMIDLMLAVCVCYQSGSLKGERKHSLRIFQMASIPLGCFMPTFDLGQALASQSWDTAN